jgi:2-methylfumaryl-CoA hydratase
MMELVEQTSRMLKNSPNLITADGPYYDWLTVGQVLAPQHAVTLDTGMAALYQSISGESLALTLSDQLSSKVTRNDARLASPGLVINLSIGQSTVATRRAIANLFYRNLRLLRPVYLGETLHTTVTIKALSDAAPKPDQVLRGKVLLGIKTTSNGDTVLDYERCALLPVSSTGSLSGHNTEVGPADSPLNLGSYAHLVPSDWQSKEFPPTQRWSSATDATRDHIDLAAGFARLTHNRAIVHRDETASVYGKRLVYGGHVVALAQASLTRCLPDIATIIGWHSCSHTGPAFEGDLLSFTHELVDQLSVSDEWAMQAVAITGVAIRDNEETEILRWTVVVVVRTEN